MNTRHNRISRLPEELKLEDWFHGDIVKEYSLQTEERKERAAQQLGDRLRKYRLTPDQFHQMFLDQDRRCAICRVGIDETISHIDHDHQSTAVRGLLCRKCNNGLGQFDDDVERLLSAVAYLRGSRGGAIQEIEKIAA